MNDRPVFIVYCHTNKKNEKRYVGWAVGKPGQSAKDVLHRRWVQHCKGAQKDYRFLFARAICKWGSGDDVWDHEILEVMTTSEGAKHAEKLWIAQKRTFAYDEGNLGYNETRGGDGTVGYKFTLAQIETLRAIRKKMKDRHRQNNLGSNNPMFGRKQTVDSRQKNSQTNVIVQNSDDVKRRNRSSNVITQNRPDVLENNRRKNQDKFLDESYRLAHRMRIKAAMNRSEVKEKMRYNRLTRKFRKQSLAWFKELKS